VPSPLDAISRTDISRIMPKVLAKLDWFSHQPSLPAAIEKAALPKNCRDKRHYHQRRPKRVALQQALGVPSEQAGQSRESSQLGWLVRSGRRRSRTDHRTRRPMSAATRRGPALAAVRPSPWRRTISVATNCGRQALSHRPLPRFRLTKVGSGSRFCLKKSAHNEALCVFSALELSRIEAINLRFGS